MMKKLLLIPLYVMLLLSIAFAQHSHNWEGTDVPGHIRAAFTNLQGSQTFKILPSSQKIRFLKYTITCLSGYMTFSVKSGPSLLFSKRITETMKDSIDIVNPEKSMKVTITGYSANGRFDIKYSL